MSVACVCGCRLLELQTRLTDSKKVAYCTQLKAAGYTPQSKVKPEHFGDYDDPDKNGGFVPSANYLVRCVVGLLLC